MQHRLAIVVSTVLLAAGAGLAALVAHAAHPSSGNTSDAPTGPKGRGASGARQFVGYWMGIDPLDGGDSRRGITVNSNRTFSIIGRDTVFTLCDGTDRAIITVNDAKIINLALVSDDLGTTCTNKNSTVKLKVRYDVIDKNIIRESVTSQRGEPVDKIIFHRCERTLIKQLTRRRKCGGQRLPVPELRARHSDHRSRTPTSARCSHCRARPAVGWFESRRRTQRRRAVPG